MMGKKRVSFGTVHTYYFLDTEKDEECRKNYWQLYALDSERFKNRIRLFETIFSKHLEKLKCKKH